MKALLLSTVTILLGLSTLFGQVTLRNSLSGKTKILKAEGQASLGLPFGGPELDCGYRMLDGKLLDINKGLIRILPKEEVKTLTFSNGLAKKETVRYEDIKALPPISLSIADIDHLSYRKKGAEGRANWGAFVTSLGVLGALVAAPLVSIGYGNGTFNSDRYFRWAGYSLGLSGVGGAMVISSKKRHFSIQRPGQPAASNLWVIEK